MGINVKRLEKLITVLENAKPENFDMGNFAVCRAGSRCGTPACVLGHYAADRKIQKAFKLSLPEVYNVQTDAYEVGKPALYDTALLVGSCTTGDSVSGESQEVADHFGITLDQGHELFSGQGCDDAKTPKQAIKYIRAFIKRNVAVEEAQKHLDEVRKMSERVIARAEDKLDRAQSRAGVV